jgi:serine/threonine protein kinase
MGQVFAVFDRERQERVALKVLGNLTSRSSSQLKQEFRAASEMIHPNLVRLHELLVDGSEWFFTMDLVEGVTLRTLLHEAPQRAADQLREIFRQLALGLQALPTSFHAGGISSPSV